ncbi:MAG: hypothetical protein PWQ69_1401 [Methanomicrobiaceae archaeon]|nr:hypothetical protein [Methanomicrobiaceae archaeon]
MERCDEDFESRLRAEKAGEEGRLSTVSARGPAGWRQ